LHIIVAEKRKMLKVNAKMYNPKELYRTKKWNFNIFRLPNQKLDRKTSKKPVKFYRLKKKEK